MVSGRAARSLSLSSRSARAVSPLKMVSGRAARSLSLSSRSARAVSPLKSPAVRLVIPEPCNKSSSIASRCVAVTSAQAVTLVTAATMASFTCVVRSHTAGVCASTEEARTSRSGTATARSGHSSTRRESLGFELGPAKLAWGMSLLPVRRRGARRVGIALRLPNSTAEAKEASHLRAPRGACRPPRAGP